MTLREEKSSPREATRLGAFLANARHGGIRGLVFMGNTLVLVPLLFVSLGKEQFAILALVTPFLRYGFNGVFDFGAAAGVVRHTSRSFAVSDTEGINSYVSSSLALYMVFGAILICLHYLLWPFLMPLLIRTNTKFYGPARIMFERAVWIYCLFSLSNPFFALLMGVQKVEATHWIGTASLLVEMSGILLLVPRGVTLTRLMWVYGANAVFSLIFSVVLGKRYFPALRLSWGHVSWLRMRDICGYGVRFSATTLAAMLSPVFDKLILARYVGLSEVALYEAAARLIDLLRRATQLFLLPLFPMASARDNTHSEGERHNFYVQAFSANLLVSGGLYLIPVSLAFGIFRVWLGPESRLAAITFVVLSLTVFCQALVGPICMILAGTGRLKPLMATALLGLSLNFTVSPVLARYWGFTGVLCGAASAYGLVSLLLLIWSLGIAEFQIPLPQLFRLGGLTILGGLLPGTVLTLVLRPGDHQSGWLPLLSAGIIASGAFIVLSLAQAEYRHIAFRVVQHTREGIWAAWRRRKLSSA